MVRDGLHRAQMVARRHGHRLAGEKRDAVELDDVVAVGVGGHTTNNENASTLTYYLNEKGSQMEPGSFEDAYIVLSTIGMHSVTGRILSSRRRPASRTGTAAAPARACPDRA